MGLGLLLVPRGRSHLPHQQRRRAGAEAALSRKSVLLFAGSDRGGARAAAMYTPINTARLNDLGPRNWLDDLLGRITETPQSQIDELLPWNWGSTSQRDLAA